MSMRRESHEEHYDIIVVGSGMGGLSAAALLAKAGKKVLVIERHDRPGGYAHAFRRKQYLFDSAVHYIADCQPNEDLAYGLIDRLLRYLGVRDRCDFLSVDPWYTAIYPGFRLQAPLGTEAFLQAHLGHFPSEAAGLRHLLEVCSHLNREARLLPAELSLWDVVRLPGQFPTLFKYRNATLGQVLDEYLADSRLKAVLATSWSNCLPPSRFSFVYWAMTLMSCLEEGAFYCRGSFQRLPNAVVEAIQRDGGELLLRSRVRRILVHDRQVQGVLLENGQRIAGPVVISNADVTETVEELVGAEQFPSAYVSHLRHMKPSLSASIAYLATDLDLRQFDVSHEIFVCPTWDHEETYRAVLAGKPGVLAVGIPTLTDPSLAPPGEHLVIVIALIPYDVGVSWRQEKAEYLELLTNALEAVIPGLHAHLTFAEGASPRTLERYTLNLTGASYGWEISPEQVGRRRHVEHQTPIEGLLLSGHWTQPGGSVTAVVLSGLQTAQLLLGYGTLIDFQRAWTFPK